MGINLAIVGATGLVGSTFIKVLEERKVEVNNFKLFASSKSAGKKIEYLGSVYTVEELKLESFKGIDYALFSAGKDIAKEYAPKLEEMGITVIDNSSYFRMFDDISLIVPEVNIKDIKKTNRRIIANPNCSTIQSMIPLNALMKFGLKRVIYTTYQAVSGSGMKGLNDYRNCLNGLSNSFYPYNITKTCIPEIDEFLDNGFTKEEMKMVNETRKILNLKDLSINATCVRVPVEFSHGVSMVVELEKDFEIDEIKDAFKKQEGLVVLDDDKNHIYPTQDMSTGKDDVFVGRIRRDLYNKNTICFYCTADNVRRGAASNAVLILLKLLEDNYA